jgi:hypothetical protein
VSQRPFAATTHHLVDAFTKWGLPGFVCFRPTFEVVRAVGGAYEVYIWIPTWNKGSASVPVTVRHAGGTTLRTFNERRATGGWILHGQYTFEAGTGGYVETDDSSGAALADAVRFVPVP